jgi:hypothetical protein
MQVSRRSLAPEEIDHELIWLLVSLGGVIGLTIWLTARLPTPQCAFHALTGLPCLTCGATRSASHFLHGEFVASFLFNPLAFLVFCSAVIFDLYALAVLVTGRPRLRLADLSVTQRRFLRRAAILLLAANWLYLLLARPF